MIDVTRRLKLLLYLIGSLAAVSLVLGLVSFWYVFVHALPFQGTRASDTSHFGEQVRDYLLANPEVIAQAAQSLDARQRQAAETEAQQALAAKATEVFHDPESPVGGNPQGDVTLVEFFDYNCPYCRAMAPVVAKAEAADRQLRIVYKDFPILGPGSIDAAKVALAAHRQQKYESFHKAMMRAKGSVDGEAALGIAAEVGLDIEQLKEDMLDPAIQAVIDRNLQLAQALRISGTPTFVIGDQILRGATDLSILQGLIADAREQEK